MEMEELKKLEKLQRTIEFMQTHRIINSSDDHHRNVTNHNADSDRFIASFVLLLTQPCGQLDLNTKCRLISEHLPMIISSALQEEDFICLGDRDTEQADSVVRDDKLAFPVLPYTEDTAMVGLDAMKRANSTLEDFCRSYFMFHGMDVKRPESIFKFLPTLIFTESYIYQLDNLNEKLLHVSVDTASNLDEESDMEESNNFILMKKLKEDPLRPLIDLLGHHGLLTNRIQEELRCGEEYWDLERKLCGALTRNREISIHDVMRASHLKSFDYRVLNLLLYQLTGQKVNDLHMEFLSISEFLVEVSDDLFDYEEDVLENNFNILRMFVRVYGPSEAPTMLVKTISEAEDKYNSLLSNLEAELSINYQKRCEEAVKEGGMPSGPCLGKWTIPPLIVDENLYRSQVLRPKVIPAN